MDVKNNVWICGLLCFFYISALQTQHNNPPTSFLLVTFQSQFLLRWKCKNWLLASSVRRFRPWYFLASTRNHACPKTSCWYHVSRQLLRVLLLHLTEQHTSANIGYRSLCTIPGADCFKRPVSFWNASLNRWIFNVLFKHGRVRRGFVEMSAWSKGCEVRKPEVGLMEIFRNIECAC